MEKLENEDDLTSFVEPAESVAKSSDNFKAPIALKPVLEKQEAEINTIVRKEDTSVKEIEQLNVIPSSSTEKVSEQLVSTAQNFQYGVRLEGFAKKMHPRYRNFFQ